MKTNVWVADCSPHGEIWIMEFFSKKEYAEEYIEEFYKDDSCWKEWGQIYKLELRK